MINNDELKQAIKSLFESGEMRIDLDTEDHTYMNGVTKIFPVVTVDGETVYSGSYCHVKTVF